MPSDPYSFPVPQSELTVKFYGYGQRLGTADAVNELFAEAINDVGRHAAVESMGTGELHWQIRDIGHIDLVLLPRSEMLWVQWGEGVRAVWTFMLVWEGVALFFDVERMGVAHRIGTGYIMKAKT